jgi:hypothetical protein
MVCEAWDSWVAFRTPLCILICMGRSSEVPAASSRCTAHNFAQLQDKLGAGTEAPSQYTVLYNGSMLPESCHAFLPLFAEGADAGLGRRISRGRVQMECRRRGSSLIGRLSGPKGNVEGKMNYRSKVVLQASRPDWESRAREDAKCLPPKCRRAGSGLAFSSPDFWPRGEPRFTKSPRYESYARVRSNPSSGTFYRVYIIQVIDLHVASS